MSEPRSQKLTFFGLIGESFNKVQGSLIGVIGIVLAIFLWRFPPVSSVPILWVVMEGLVIILAVATLGNALSKAVDQAREVNNNGKD